MFSAAAIQEDVLLQTIDFYARYGSMEEAIANGTLSVRIGNRTYSGSEITVTSIDVSTTSPCPVGSVEDVVACSKCRSVLRRRLPIFKYVIHTQLICF